MKKSLQEKLKTYSLLSSVAVLGSASAQGQIIHKDVNYVGGYDSYDIDIDGDAFGDFNFIKNSQTFNPYSSYTYQFKGLYVSGLKSQNNVVGYDYNGYVNYAFSVWSNQEISFYSGPNWVNSAFMAGDVILSNGSLYGNFGSFGEDLFEYKFLGFKFDIDGSNHYGWMRFKFNTANGSSWFLKDVAYNSEADEPIKAGEMPLVSIEENEDNLFEISSNENQLNITVDAEMINSSLEVIDLSGRVVLSQNLIFNKEQVSHNLPKGIYVVRLFNKEKAITRKINM